MILFRRSRVEELMRAQALTWPTLARAMRVRPERLRRLLAAGDVGRFHGDLFDKMCTALGAPGQFVGLPDVLEGPVREGGPRWADAGK